MKGICKLCKKESTLRASHIIPKFVFKWMKATGAEYFRSPANPNIRIQDGVKDYILCDNCEQLFSTSEKWFSTNIFESYLSKHQTTFIYESELSKFIASILWRTAIICMDDSDVILSDRLNKACSEWSSYLLANIIPSNFNEFHLLFIGDEWGGPQPHQFLTRYFTRVVDCHVVELADNEAWVYAKFARFILLGRINGNKPISRYSQVFFKPGILSVIQYIDNPEFSMYLIDRSAAIYDHNQSQISATQVDIIEKHLAKNYEKISTLDLGRRTEQDLHAEIAPFGPDHSFKYVCDCCISSMAEPEGFLLRTFEILLSEKFWKQYFKFVNLSNAEQDALERADHFKVIAEQNSPWTICENCISMFNIDIDLAKEYLRNWTSKKGQYSPPYSENYRNHLTQDEIKKILMIVMTC